MKARVPSPNRAVALLVCLLGVHILPASFALAQVSPSEIVNPQLKECERTYLPEILDLSRAIRAISFPFPFRVSRFAGLDPTEQAAADERGLEFVSFHDRVVLKVTGNYNAAFNADLLTANRRANRVLDEVVVPIMGTIHRMFPAAAGFDAFGFEIAYHTLRREHGSRYEGKEILALVIDKTDVARYLAEAPLMRRQAVLDRSEIFLNGKPFGLALAEPQPLDLSAQRRRDPILTPAAAAGASRSGGSNANPAAPSDPLVTSASSEPRIQPHTAAPSGSAIPASGTTDSVDVPAGIDLEKLRADFQTQLDDLALAGAQHHFVSYAPPSFVVVHNQVALQVTLRNPDRFDKDATSIYRRAALSFDLFFARELRYYIERLPESTRVGTIDVTILNELTSSSGASSEAVEFLFPSNALHRFASGEIANQELINQSVVLVNDVRISLDLQQAERIEEVMNAEFP